MNDGRRRGEENRENDSMKIVEFTFIMRHKSISIHSVFSYRYVSSFTSYAGMEGRTKIRTNDSFGHEYPAAAPVMPSGTFVQYEIFGSINVNE